MRKTGSNFELKEDRDNAVLREFHRMAARCASISMSALMPKVVKQPAPRFWVSEERATIVVSAMLRGLQVTHGMGQWKRRMFAEIYRRVQSLREQHASSPLVWLVREVVNSPAPEYYMSPRSAQNIVGKMLSR